MKQLLILSGKGGTGKTTIAGAFIKLASAKAYADCDVDAPNLHLLMAQIAQPHCSEYYGLPKAEINSQACQQCGLCRQNCRFQAISQEFKVDSYACEGCGLCAEICPVGAVSLIKAAAGELQLFLADSVFSTAQLKMGSGTSGMLVTEVKKQLKIADLSPELVIIDGSPGIGCPVIASLSGVDMVLIVAEPSLSGIHDLRRIVETAGVFQIKAAVCINKADCNQARTAEIELLCQQLRLPLVGRIPFDSKVVTAVNNGQSIVELDCAAGQAVKEVFQKTIEMLYT